MPSIIDVKKTPTWGESRFPARLLEALIVAETDDARGIEDASDALADFLEDQGYNTDQDWIGDDKLTTVDLEVWPESHWPGFALHEADVFKTYMAWWCM